MRRTVQHFAARVADEVIDRGERFHGDPDPWDGLAMRWMVFAVALLLIGSATACTKENSAFCCTTAEDCARFGASDLRDCDQGLVCVNNACQSQSCESQGCTAAAPNCDVTTDVCVGCADASECMRFPATSVCDTTSGSCVECLVDADCGAATPVCDASACRACRADSECASGACGDDGQCIPASAIVYVATNGVDAAPCSQAQPCRTLRYALQETSSTRQDLVFASGSYASSSLIGIDPGTTTAPFLTIHGHGAKLTGTSEDGLLIIRKAGAIHDLEVENSNGNAISIVGTYNLDRVKVRSDGGTTLSTIIVNGSVTMRDTSIAGSGCGLRLDGGAATLDRGVISAARSGICANGAASVDIKNLLVWGASDVGLDLPGVTGGISFSTIAYTGNASGSSAAGLRCTQQALSVTASILWTPASFGPVIAGGCEVSGSIVGPQAFGPNASNNPMFRNPVANDFRLSGGSPAHDQVNTGPAFDFEHEARPQGVRFDLGADESP